jgi:hypothetical protein
MQKLPLKMTSERQSPKKISSIALLGAISGVNHKAPQTAMPARQDKAHAARTWLIESALLRNKA